MQVKDGTGKGYEAKVDNSNRLWTNAIAEREISSASKNGDAYLFPTLWSTLAAADTEHAILRISNGKVGYQLHANKIFVGWTGGDTNYNRPLIGRMYADMDAPTAHNVTTAGGNLNLSSAKTSDVTADIWNNSTGNGMTVASTGSFKNAMVTSIGYEVVDIEGSLILGPGDVLGFTLESPEIGSFQVAMSGWFVEI